jgi:hypothetical protein
LTFGASTHVHQYCQLRTCEALGAAHHDAGKSRCASYNVSAFVALRASRGGCHSEKNREEKRTSLASNIDSKHFSGASCTSIFVSSRQIDVNDQ